MGYVILYHGQGVAVTDTLHDQSDTNEKLAGVKFKGNADDSKDPLPKGNWKQSTAPKGKIKKR